MSADPRRDATAQQRLGSDPGQSVWVSANAGTGKTRVLTDRITRLLLNGTPPGRILCLTFTKAAAAEMAGRLGHRLGTWAVMGDAELKAALTELLGRDPGDDLTRARRLFAQSLEVPGGLKIQTIHAFCESLLARFPIEAGVSPHFSVVEERTAAELLQDARDRVLAGAFQDGDGALAGALDHMASLVDEAQFDEVMRELQAARGRLSRLIARHGGLEPLLTAIWQALGLGPEETDAHVLAEACAGADEPALRRACATLAGGSKTDVERGIDLAAWLDAAPGDRARRFEAYALLFLTKDGEPRKTLLTKKPAEADPATADALIREQERLHQLAEKRRAVGVAEATRALLTLGGRLLESYRAAKQARALLDYDDLILRARDLLAAHGGVSWVLYKLDGGIDHILVDEAQDTSPEQWDIVGAIAEEFFAGEAARPPHRTLFVVGDEKQSIYSFQGADPEGFETMRGHFAQRAEAAEERLSSVEMAVSFRSTKAVLQAVDAVFASAVARDGLNFAGREILHRWSRTGEAGLVELWDTETHEDEAEEDPWDTPLDQLPVQSPQARLAARIADTIQGWIEKGEVLEAKGRPITAGDVMILVRKRGAFVEKMVRELKVRHIPVAGTDRMVLTDQLAVMDLMAVGRFALLPGDDLNTACVLKGPLVGLDDDDLFALAWKRNGTLWAALEARRADTPAWSAAHAVLAEVRARADFTPPFEFFAELLGKGGGRRKLLARLGPEANDPVDEFLALALDHERDHVPSLQGFLHWLEAGRAQVKRDLEQGHGEVRVMTVHGAKGLQAPVVFLPDTCTLPRAQQDPRLKWRLDGPEPIVLWPPRRADEEGLSRELREEARRRQEQEYRRLLYVAMTRAEDRLYVCGWEGKRGREGGCWYDLVAAALATEDNAVAEGRWRMTCPQEVDAPKPAPSTTTEEIASLPAWARMPPPPEPDPPRPLVPSRPSGDDPPARPPFGPDDGARFKRGRLVHRLLQTLPDLPPERRDTAARAFLARPAHDLEEAEQAAIATEVAAVLVHPDFAPLFGPGSRAEVPLVGTLDGVVVSGQVDRLVVTAESVLVVDYKTNRPPPRTVDGVAPVYLRQMAAYRALLADIWPGRTVRAALLWTDGPSLMELPHVLLNGAPP